jgi:metal-dependent amidase/aminoacylase/carboxypeptidase family protein
VREHVKPTVRVHCVIHDGGDVPNVVPDHARVWVWAGDFERPGADEVVQRLRKAVEGAAVMAGVEGGLRVHKGRMQAAKTLAATMVDLFDGDAARAAVRTEFEAKTKGVVYRAAVPDGPPPVPKAQP